MDESQTIVESSNVSHHNNIKTIIDNKLEGIVDEKLLQIKSYLKDNGAFDSGYNDLMGYSVLELMIILDDQKLVGSSNRIAVSLFLKILKKADATNLVKSSRELVKNETAHIKENPTALNDSIMRLIEAVDKQKHTGASLAILTKLFEGAIDYLEKSSNQVSDDMMTIEDPLAKYSGDMDRTIIDEK